MFIWPKEVTCGASENFIFSPKIVVFGLTPKSWTPTPLWYTFFQDIDKKKRIVQIFLEFNLSKNGDQLKFTSRLTLTDATILDRVGIRTRKVHPLFSFYQRGIDSKYLPGNTDF